MSKTNPGRTLGSERTVAARIAMERKDRGWTYDTVARRMEGEGCPIQLSALHKIEKADPPRRVTLDEAIALANVFRLSLEDLVTPIALVKERQAREIAEQIPQARKALEDAVTEALRLYVSYGRLARDSEDLREFMDHRAGHEWNAMAAPTHVDLGDEVSQEEADDLATRLEDMWMLIVHLGRLAAGPADRDAD